MIHLDNQIRVFPCPDGQLQRVQAVTLPNWEDLAFLRPEPSGDGFASFCNIYRRYLVPACPWIFGRILLFRLPEGISVPGSPAIADPLTRAAIVLKKGIRHSGSRVCFRTPEAEVLYRQLEQQDCVQTVCGKLPITTIIPVSDRAGYLTQAAPDARMKVNGSFFIMDPVDCATVYDHVGTPIGLQVKNGTVENPPLYDREALLVDRTGTVSVRPVKLTDLRIRIGSTDYIPGENARLYTRPERAKTPGGNGIRLVITGCHVAAVHTGGRVPIPASGFVLCPDVPCAAKPGDVVRYLGLENISFGIQVGNSILRDGVKTQRFLSRFYNIRKLEPVPFPPSLYTMDFKHARAARIALGADKDGRPMVLWAEGAAKLGHDPTRDSRGASLMDMAEFCQRMGMHHAIHLDGGGSAQLLVENRRSLKISDRQDASGTEAERPVPLGLQFP